MHERSQSADKSTKTLRYKILCIIFKRWISNDSEESTLEIGINPHTRAKTEKFNTRFNTTPYTVWWNKFVEKYSVSLSLSVSRGKSFTRDFHSTRLGGCASLASFFDFTRDDAGSAVAFLP